MAGLINQEEQYHKLVDRHKQYLKIQQGHRQKNWMLKKEAQKLQILNEIVYSPEYQQKIDEAISRYHQLEALQQQNQQMIKDQKIKPEQIELIKLDNDKIRDQVAQLNFQVAIQLSKNGIFEEQYRLFQNYVEKYEEALRKCQEQIEELKKKDPLKESVWRRLARQRIESILIKAEREESEMTSEEEVNLIENGCFLKLIYQKVKEVQELSLKMKRELVILKEKDILNKQLKIQNDIVSKMFGFDSFGQKIDNQDDLRVQDEQLDRQIMRLQEEISKEQEAELHMRQNLGEIAKSGACQKTRDYLRQKGGEIKYKLKIMQQTLPLILMGGSQSANEQAQSIIKQVTAMKQELDRLQRGIGINQICMREH